MIAPVAEVVDPGDSDCRVGAVHEPDCNPGFDPAFPEHATVPAGASRLGHACRQCRDVPAAADLDAGIPRSCDLNVSVPDRVDVADARGRLIEPIDGEVLTEAPRTDLGSTQFLPPGGVGPRRGEERGLIRRAMVLEIGFGISR